MALKVHITNFSGLTLRFFCFLSPRLIDMGRVHHQSNLENLEQAFDVAERDLGVTRLLDPEGKTSLSHPHFSGCNNLVQYFYDGYLLLT